MRPICRMRPRIDAKPPSPPNRPWPNSRPKMPAPMKPAASPPSRPPPKKPGREAGEPKVGCDDGCVMLRWIGAAWLGAGRAGGGARGRARGRAAAAAAEAAADARVGGARQHAERQRHGEDRHELTKRETDHLKPPSCRGDRRLYFRTGISCRNPRFGRGRDAAAK